MNEKYFLGILAFALIFLSGCLLHLCEDGRTIATNSNECPKIEIVKIDTEYEECSEAPMQKGDYDYESPRDMCFYNLALTRENVTLCQKILNTDYYSEYSPAKCGASIALLKNDSNACEPLGPTYKYDCYSELVAETEDPSYCDKITLKQKKEDCLYDYVYYQGDPISDWSICGKFSSGSSDADYCYYSAALSKKDTTFCDKIAGDSYYGYSRASCYGELAFEKKNTSLCELLTTTLEKDDCYYIYATSYPYNTTICDKIRDEYKKSDCVYYEVDYANYTY